MSGLDRALIGVSTWAMAITGAAYWWMKYRMTSRDPFSAFHHPWQPYALALHVVAAPVAVFALGLIARDHILDRILDARQRRGRASGLAIAGLALPMIATGYLLQVWTDPAPRRILVVVHLATGSLYALLFAAHLVVGRPLGRAGNGGRKGSGSRTSRPRGLDWRARRGIGSWSRRRRLDRRAAGSEDTTP